LCSCNGTLPLDPEALSRMLELAGAPYVHGQLCQKEISALVDAEGECLVGCTQEQKRFREAAESGKPQSVAFFNLREAAGWSQEARSATPKIAALIAAAALPEPEPVPRVTFKSEGRLLIVGQADAALYWAGKLKDQLAVTVLIAGRAIGNELPPA